MSKTTEILHHTLIFMLIFSSQLAQSADNCNEDLQHLKKEFDAKIKETQEEFKKITTQLIQENQELKQLFHQQITKR